jgi:hypothetical protein
MQWLDSGGFRRTIDARKVLIFFGNRLDSQGRHPSDVKLDTRYALGPHLL